MIWSINIVCSAIALVISVWAVLSPNIRTRVLGTIAFSCLGLFAAVHIRKPILWDSLPNTSALVLSMTMMILSIWLLTRYQSDPFGEGES